MENKEYKINQGVVQGLIRYLASRPYNEVFEGITALQNLEEIKDE